MRKLIALAAAAATLALAGTATATAGSGGAVVATGESCWSNVFVTACTTVRTTTNATTTPSGNVVYVTNGTVEYRQTYSFGGTFTSVQDLHVNTLQKRGNVHVSFERLLLTSQSRSGSYALDCTTGFTIHYANGSVQIADSITECTTP